VSAIGQLIDSEARGERERRAEHTTQLRVWRYQQLTVPCCVTEPSPSSWTAAVALTSAIRTTITRRTTLRSRRPPWQFVLTTIGGGTLVLTYSTDVTDNVNQDIFREFDNLNFEFERRRDLGSTSSSPGRPARNQLTAHLCKYQSGVDAVSLRWDSNTFGTASGFVVLQVHQKPVNDENSSTIHSTLCSKT
jgi:hypothetical protein